MGDSSPSLATIRVNQFDAAFSCIKFAAVVTKPRLGTESLQTNLHNCSRAVLPKHLKHIPAASLKIIVSIANKTCLE